jgi:hypothetical protein
MVEAFRRLSGSHRLGPYPTGTGGGAAQYADAIFCGGRGQVSMRPKWEEQGSIRRAVSEEMIRDLISYTAAYRGRQATAEAKTGTSSPFSTTTAAIGVSIAQ